MMESRLFTLRFQVYNVLAFVDILNIYFVSHICLVQQFTSHERNKEKLQCFTDSIFSL